LHDSDPISVHGEDRQFLPLHSIHSAPVHGGRQPESSPGIGCRFFVHVEPAKTRRQQSHGGARHGFRGRIDNATSNDELADFLRLRGCRQQAHGEQLQ
jgi:hypothetical protein